MLVVVEKTAPGSVESKLLVKSRCKSDVRPLNAVGATSEIVMSFMMIVAIADAPVYACDKDAG
jgi:hypothetical protein